MAKTTFTLQVIGLKQLQRKLRPDVTLHEPYRASLEEAAVAARDIIRQGAPKGTTGALAGKLVHRLHNAPVPRYAVVKTTATRSSPRYRRYSYPKRLEFDPKSKHKDWMLDGLMRAKGKVQSILGKTARHIEQKWSR